MRKNNTVIIKPTPMNGMAIYLILSVFAVIAPIILTILIDIRLIALLPACALPICYMIYRIVYLDKCSIIINYTDKSVTLRKPLKELTIPIENVRWSAKKVGVRNTSYIIKVSADNKTIMKLRGENWENIKELFYLPHCNGKDERN
jgi:hypothetical protein